MKIYRELSLKFKLHTVATIGIFDGVHLAHKQIIKRLSELAKSSNTESMLITMWPHPRYVLDKDADELKLISTLDEKLYRLEKAGLDNVLIVPFDRDFSELPFDRFIKRILVDKLMVKSMVIGFNHHFGKDRQGNFASLSNYGRRFGFELEQMPKVEIDGIGVSSTVIRENILLGNMEIAAKMLGYNFCLTGRVVHGSKVGRKLGFPTANIEVQEIYKIIPTDGVYAIEAEVIGRKVKGMLNIGTRPTIDNRGKTVVEANIFDFNEEIYDKDITIHFFKRIREEKKFDSTEQLIEQINVDKLEIQYYLSK